MRLLDPGRDRPVPAMDAAMNSGGVQPTTLASLRWGMAWLTLMIGGGLVGCSTLASTPKTQDAPPQVPWIQAVHRTWAFQPIWLDATTLRMSVTTQVRCRTVGMDKDKILKLRPGDEALHVLEQEGDFGSCGPIEKRGGISGLPVLDREISVENLLVLAWAASPPARPIPNFAAQPSTLVIWRDGWQRLARVQPGPDGIIQLPRATILEAVFAHGPKGSPRLGLVYGHAEQETALPDPEVEIHVPQVFLGTLDWNKRREHHAQKAREALKEGDLLSVASSGAYGFAMSSNYNSRTRAAEVMVDGNTIHLIRERETIADLMKGEFIIP